VLGSFRRWCQQLDCSPEGEDLLTPFVPKRGLSLPRRDDGFVAFRGDDPLLPDSVRAVTQLHVKFIPTQASHPRATPELAEQLCKLRVQLGLQPSPMSAFLPWLESHLVGLEGERQHSDAVPMSDVMAVRDAMTGVTGHLVGVPIDKNHILYFEDAAVYSKRLIRVFVKDTRLIMWCQSCLLTSC
jgi:hypothetical protein